MQAADVGADLVGKVEKDIPEVRHVAQPRAHAIVGGVCLVIVKYQTRQLLAFYVLLIIRFTAVLYAFLQLGAWLFASTWRT